MRTRHPLNGLVIASSLLAALGCAPTPDPDEPTPDVDASVRLGGAVAKGPFVLGSTVVVSPVDAAGDPSGDQFSTQTANNLGEFDVVVAASGPAALEATGFYYNEVTGDLSLAPITLRAWAVLSAQTDSEPQQAFINTVTHLASNRVAALLAGGETIGDASAQAEGELYAALALGAAPPTEAGTALNLLDGGSRDAAYLLLVSSVFAQAATRRGGSIDANLQELMNTVAADLADDGAIAPALTNELAAAQRSLDVNQVLADLAARFADTGATETPPDLGAIVDQDGDGLVHNDDNCPRAPNPQQEDRDDNGVGDVCDCGEADCTCGDGTVDDGEDCDDGNVLPGDGCSAFCLAEPEPACMIDSFTSPLSLPVGVGAELPRAQVSGRAPDFTCAAPTVGPTVTLEGCLALFGLGNRAKAGTLVDLFTGTPNEVAVAAATTEVATATQASGLDCAGADAGAVACSALSCSSQGYYRLSDVPTGVTIALRVRHPADATVIATTSFGVVLDPAAAVDGVVARSVTGVLRSTYDSLPTLAGRIIDGGVDVTDGVGRALIIGRAVDCTGGFVENAVAAWERRDGVEATIYFDGEPEDPSPDLSRGGTATDGLFAFVNVVTTPGVSELIIAERDGCSGFECSCAPLSVHRIATAPDSVSLVGF